MRFRLKVLVRVTGPLFLVYSLCVLRRGIRKLPVSKTSQQGYAETALPRVSPISTCIYICQTKKIHQMNFTRGCMYGVVTPPVILSCKLGGVYSNRVIIREEVTPRVDISGE